MKEPYEYLIEILNESVKKNGDKLLTTQYLLNIIRMVEKRIIRDSEREEMYSMPSDFPNW